MATNSSRYTTGIPTPTMKAAADCRVLTTSGTGCLSAGKQVWGIAVDDSHHFQKEFGPERSNPGRGWVQVRTDKLDVDGVLQALDAGDFYASTGVALADLRSTRGEIALEIESGDEARFTTVFTGQRGALELHVSDSLSPRYRPSRLDSYVRATVYSSRGTKAWTQPVFIPGG